MSSQSDVSDIRRDLVSLLPRLRRFGLACCGQPDAVDSLVREACARAVLNCPRLDDGDRLESWVFSLIRAIWAEDGKKQAAAKDEELRHGFAHHDAILALPTEAAASFLLVAVENHSHAQAADILAIEPEAVAMHVLMARRHFAQLSVTAAERRA
ncbi:sigma factor-like helix-turn-helix DNA-binding protein [Neorhizobium sp. NPDC001467]|uniref:sigma factor-like helix-turn-helix DNA-binding protein n=1 Tax=Neorhizobium sp. NPDC001467 TaxID=3390595 RepID=UPI003D04F3A2